MSLYDRNNFCDQVICGFQKTKKLSLEGTVFDQNQSNERNFKLVPAISVFE